VLTEKNKNKDNKKLATMPKNNTAVASAGSYECAVCAAAAARRVSPEAPSSPPGKRRTTEERC